MKSTNPGRISRSFLALIGPVLMAGQTVCAEPKSQDAAAVQALKKTQGVLRQIVQEKAALEAENTALASDKAGLENRVKGLEEALRKLQALPGEVERLTSTQGRLEAQISQGRERERSLTAKYRDVVGKAKAMRSDNQLLIQVVKEREQWMELCGERNRTLRHVVGEVVDKYQEKGLWDELAELEPFTGIGKVSTENAVEEYRYKLESLKITPFQDSRPARETTAQSPPAVEGEEDEEQAP
ncbi:hypothetical protein [Methylococcus sp. EFPC2]|uniref:hypothetical protein n=1 Tax=Methylococcus sp. EFPC2 TaxID=2812648 RepID=UPI001968216B|nr:hypothetical protein [Methylococcus sp. EFPC2]QSA98267.1 hypothetical protein JWZ97_05475 [Methylococcus sp. EFPC2]